MAHARILLVLALFVATACAGYDLVPASMTFSPASTIVTQTFNVTVGINRVLDAGDLPPILTYDVTFYTLEPNATSWTTAGKQQVKNSQAAYVQVVQGITPSKNGTYGVLAVVDEKGATSETNRTNDNISANYSVGPTPSVDLFAYGITYEPPRGSVGLKTNVTFYFGVSSATQAPDYQVPFNVTLLYTEPDGSQWITAGSWILSLGLNSIGNFSTSFTPAKEGNYSFALKVDPADKINETNETNNVYLSQYEVRPMTLIDLSVTGLSAAPSGGQKAGETVTVTATTLVDTPLPGPMLGITYTVFLYDEAPGATSKVLVANATVTTKIIPEASTVTFNFTSLAVGNHTLSVYVDPYDELPEMDEGNNEREVPYTILEQPTVLTVSPSITGDSSGWVELSAVAGYSVNGVLYCYDTNVTVTSGTSSWTLNKYYNCKFSKMAQLPVGSYTLRYHAAYPDYQAREKTQTVTIPSGSDLTVTVYGVQNNSVYRTNQSILISAVPSMGGRTVFGGEGIAALMWPNNDSIVVSSALEQDYLGILKGYLTLTNVSDGKYVLAVATSYSYWYAEKRYNVTVNNTAQPVLNYTPSLQLNLVVLYPRKEQYAANSTIPLQMQLEDASGLLVTGATANAAIWKDGLKVADVPLAELQYLYRSQYQFVDSGDYSINFTASKPGKNGTAAGSAAVSISVGNRTEQKVNFTIGIISPQSDVYAEGSTLIVRAKVMIGGEPARNATVVAIFNSTQYPMTYDKYGEYVTSIGPLPEAEYELLAMATLDNLTARDKVDFMTSHHRLSAELVAPGYQERIDLKKGDAVNIKVMVLDETNDIVHGAQVIASILEPSGRAIEVQAFQNNETGEYETVLFPNDDGVYKITADCTKTGYVSSSLESEFTVAMKKERILPFKIDFETLLTIAIVLAIIILLAAIVRVVL